jgi:hypothetical protein
LKGHTERVNRARWGGPETEGYFVITKAGSTEVSTPIKRMYLEQ